MNVSRQMLEANRENAGRLALGVGEPATLSTRARSAEAGQGLAGLLPRLAIAGWQGEPQPLRT